MSVAGWYPDPVGDYEVRWWDGVAWTPSVANRGVAFEDPDLTVDLPAGEQVLWEGDRAKLTTHRVWLPDPLYSSTISELPLWCVADAIVTRESGAKVEGTGRVAVEVAYQGYTGPRTWTIQRVREPHVLAAVIRKWANRNRRQRYGAYQAQPGGGW